VSEPAHFERQDAADSERVDPEKLEVAPGRKREGLEGWVPELATDSETCEALEKAFDYRGDVTLTLKTGTKIEGYVFDRVAGATLSTSFVRILPKTGGGRMKIAYTDILALSFSGRDPAAGKSWDAWVRKYWEKKEAGVEGASLHPDMGE